MVLVAKGNLSIDTEEGHTWELGHKSSRIEGTSSARKVPFHSLDSRGLDLEDLANFLCSRCWAFLYE